MRDWKKEFEKRRDWIALTVMDAGAKGVVFGNSGGKDSALVGILCKAACQNTLGVMMPCESEVNYGQDREHAEKLAKQFNIETSCADLTKAKRELAKAVGVKSRAANVNMNPRLRMTALYALAHERGCLVAGTGNLSEIVMGYFTKFGDGAYDFNPIADLTATEVREFLVFLGAPQEITEKQPSAGLYEGQTDEGEMGISYADLDACILTGKAKKEVKEKIGAAIKKTEHKRQPPKHYR